MAKKLYIGNLPHSVDNDELQDLFESYGTVVSSQVIMDQQTGRSKGFGFVEMGTDEEAQAAINAMNGTEVGGRPLTVNEARPRGDRPQGSRPPRSGGDRNDRNGPPRGRSGQGFGGGGRRY